MFYLLPQILSDLVTRLGSVTICYAPLDGAISLPSCNSIFTQVIRIAPMQGW